jgi:hypothetical protein
MSATRSFPNPVSTDVADEIRGAIEEEVTMDLVGKTADPDPYQGDIEEHLARNMPESFFSDLVEELAGRPYIYLGLAKEGLVKVGPQDLSGTMLHFDLTERGAKYLGYFGLAPEED